MPTKNRWATGEQRDLVMGVKRPLQRNEIYNELKIDSEVY
jgi:hypothetical protein